MLLKSGGAIMDSNTNKVPSNEHDMQTPEQPSAVQLNVPYFDTDHFDGASYYDVGSYHINPKEYGASDYTLGFGGCKE